MQCAHITRDMQPLQQTLQEHHQPLGAPQTHRAGSSPVFPPRSAASSSFIPFPLPGSCSALCRAELPEAKRPHAFSLLGQAGLAAPNTTGRSALAG